MATRAKSLRRWIQATRMVSALALYHRCLPVAKRSDGTPVLAPIRFDHPDRCLPLMRRGNHFHRAQRYLFRVLPRAPNRNPKQICHQLGGMDLHIVGLPQPLIYPRSAFRLPRLYSMGLHHCNSRRTFPVVAPRQHKDMDIGMVLSPLVSWLCFHSPVVLFFRASSRIGYFPLPFLVKCTPSSYLFVVFPV